MKKSALYFVRHIPELLLLLSAIPICLGTWQAVSFKHHMINTRPYIRTDVLCFWIKGNPAVEQKNTRTKKIYFIAPQTVHI